MLQVLQQLVARSLSAFRHEVDNACGILERGRQELVGILPLMWESSLRRPGPKELRASAHRRSIDHRLRKGL